MVSACIFFNAGKIAAAPERGGSSRILLYFCFSQGAVKTSSLYKSAYKNSALAILLSSALSRAFF